LKATDTAERTELLQQELAMRDAPEEVANEVKRESSVNTLPRMGKETSIQKTGKNILTTQQLLVL